MLNRGAFMVLQDMTGRIQLYVNRKTLPEATLEAIKHFDLGDIVAAEGTLARSGKGDLYVEMADVRLLTKSLRPSAGQASRSDRHRTALSPALR